MSYTDEIEKSNRTTSNSVQVPLWSAKIASFNNKIVLPLILYFDEFEVGNPLGSHASIHKLGAIYVTIANILPKFRPKLENILLFALFHSSDLKRFGNKELFHDLIIVLNKLGTEGIGITVNGLIYQIYFVLALIIGDNLCQRTILGFNESFSANYPCRFCKVNKQDQGKKLQISKELLRTENTYTEDVSHLGTMQNRDIRENSVWNDVILFHVSKNMSVDIMHDFYEGIGNFKLALLLNNFIYVDKLYSLKTLTEYIEFFLF